MLNTYAHTQGSHEGSYWEGLTPYNAVQFRWIRHVTLFENPNYMKGDTMAKAKAKAKKSVKKTASKSMKKMC